MSVNVKISPPLLSSVLDEASECCEGRSHRGIIFGTRTVRRIEEHCDSQENRTFAESSISVTSYTNFRETHPVWSKDANAASSSIATFTDRGDIVGLLVIRHDGHSIPSFRDVAAARSFLKAMDKDNSDTFPFLILVISVDSVTDKNSSKPSWVYGMNFNCFGIHNHSDT